MKSMLTLVICFVCSTAFAQYGPGAIAQQYPVQTQQVIVPQQSEIGAPQPTIPPADILRQGYREVWSHEFIPFNNGYPQQRPDGFSYYPNTGCYQQQYYVPQLTYPQYYQPQYQYNNYYQPRRWWW